ncbi:hypothetical protein Pint_28433 [Pistacia integerrima]|uniref:Uncharacterized protein n=1 Tax=Pistacia integerrima TaxID=434235 RepID=A0ACC0YUJ0_9ROSI|nr:hypothetical protein Pint_28433 [Pistacia integerrima]
MGGRIRVLFPRDPKYINPNPLKLPKYGRSREYSTRFAAESSNPAPAKDTPAKYRRPEKASRYLVSVLMKLSQRNGRCGRSRSIHIVRTIKLPVIGMGGVGKIFGKPHSKVSFQNYYYVKEAGEIPIDPHQVICFNKHINLRDNFSFKKENFICTGWSNHFVSKRKYHVIKPKRHLKDDVFDIQNHLFHGFGCFPLMGLKVFHGFGCSALMRLKVFHGFGCSALMGLKVFHGFGCSALMGLKEVVSIFVEEKSWTSGTEFVQFFRPGKSLLKMCQRRSMDLRLLHGVAYGHP